MTEVITKDDAARLAEACRGNDQARTRVIVMASSMLSALEKDALRRASRRNGHGKTERRASPIIRQVATAPDEPASSCGH